MFWWTSDLPSDSLITLLLATVAQVSRPFVRLLSLLYLPKGLKCEALAVVGISVVRVQVDGLLVSL